MPDDDVTIIPPCELKDEWGLFCAERHQREHVHYSYWVDTWNNAPELARIRHARRTLNFQHCGLCVEWNAKVAAAYRTDDAAKQRCSRFFERASGPPKTQESYTDFLIDQLLIT